MEERRRDERWSDGRRERERERKRERERGRDLLGGMVYYTVYENCISTTLSLIYAHTCSMNDDIHVHVHITHNVYPENWRFGDYNK